MLLMVKTCKTVLRQHRIMIAVSVPMLMALAICMHVASAVRLHHALNLPRIHAIPLRSSYELTAPAPVLAIATTLSPLFVRDPQTDIEHLVFGQSSCEWLNVVIVRMTAGAVAAAQGPRTSASWTRTDKSQCERLLLHLDAFTLRALTVVGRPSMDLYNRMMAIHCALRQFVPAYALFRAYTIFHLADVGKHGRPEDVDGAPPLSQQTILNLRSFYLENALSVALWHLAQHEERGHVPLTFARHWSNSLREWLWGRAVLAGALSEAATCLDRPDAAHATSTKATSSSVASATSPVLDALNGFLNIGERTASVISYAQMAESIHEYCDNTETQAIKLDAYYRGMNALEDVLISYRNARMLPTAQQMNDMQYKERNPSSIGQRATLRYVVLAPTICAIYWSSSPPTAPPKAFRRSFASEDQALFIDAAQMTGLDPLPKQTSR